MDVLKDKLLIVLVLTLFVIFVLFVFVWFMSPGNSVSDGGFKVGENLSEQQKNLVFDVAMNSAILKERLDGAGLTLASGNVGGVSENVHVENVSVASYTDFDSHVSGVLPVITFTVGGIVEGATLQAFVDPDNKRVVYIRETWRSINSSPNNTTTSISIEDTGYDVNTSLTDGEQTVAIKIALENESVKKYLDGNNYTLNSVGIGESLSSNGNSSVYYACPIVTFYVKPSTMPPIMIGADVDIKNDKVLAVNWIPVEPH